MFFFGTSQVHSTVTKETLCKTSDFISAKVSPDGKLVAKVGADEHGIANVSIISSSGNIPLTYFKTPEIIQFFWSADSRKILLLKDENGTGQLNLHGFDIESKDHICYTEKFQGVNAKLIQLSQTKNSGIVGLNNRNPQFHDLYTLDLDSGELTLLLENNRYAKFLVSDELEIILKMQINQDGSWSVFLENDDLFLTLSTEEAFQTEFLSYNSAEKTVYFLDNRYENTNQLTAKSGSIEKVLGGQIDSDIDEVIFVKGKPAAYASYYTRKKWHIITPEINDSIENLTEKIGPDFELVSQSRDSMKWIVSNSPPDQGTFFWLYDRNDSTLNPLSPANDEKHAKMYDMIVTARDGENLVCYYTLPEEHDLGGHVESPIPLIVIPHGGPFKVRDRFKFNPYHQWLASCGYAVLSVNFRLSSGFGKAFVNAGNGEWGGKAHLDVIDAIEACIARGITEKGKLGIFGGSYGGYEALAALTFSPDYYTCLISICGPSHLKTVLASVPQFWEFTSKPLSDHLSFFTKQAFITSMGGDPDDAEGAAYLEKCSPLNYLENIQAPLLLIHGKNDHVVTVNESEQIYQSMKKNGQDVTYLLFPNEGHRFGNPANKLMYLDMAERFLSKHQHGSYTPAPPSLLSSSTGQTHD